MQGKSFKTRTGKGCLVSPICVSCTALLLLSGLLLLGYCTPCRAENNWAHSSIGATQPSQTWYFAEGATAGGFETWLLVQNPGAGIAQVTITYYTEQGEVTGLIFDMPPWSCCSIDVGSSVQADHVSSKVESDMPVVAERSTYYNDRTCAHSSIGATQPSQTWYFAEGATAGGFETWVLLQNPGSELAQVRLTCHTDGGEIPGPDLVVPAGCRRSVNLGNTVRDYEVSTSVRSDRPVVAERSTYYNDRTCAHSSIGATQPSQTWYFAEGATAGGFETWVLVQNPGTDVAHITMTYQTDSGEVAGPVFDMEPLSRRSVDVGDIVEAFEASTIVESDMPVVAERSTYYNDRACAHSSIGATQPSQTWYFAEGATASEFDTWLLVQNPNQHEVDLGLYFQFLYLGWEEPLRIVPAGSRLSYNLRRHYAELHQSAIIDSTPGGVVSERAMYSGTYIYTEHSTGVEVEVGEEFIISLYCCPTTGYGWKWSEPSGAGLVGLVDEGFYRYPVPPYFCGGGGEKRWTFRAAYPGTTTLSFEYFPPAKDAPPDDIKDFRVVVHR